MYTQIFSLSNRQLMWIKHAFYVLVSCNNDYSDIISASSLSRFVWMHTIDTIVFCQFLGRSVYSILGETELGRI